MNKFRELTVLAIVAAALALPQAAPAQTGNTAQPQHQAEIKDAAEYNAYISAIQQQDLAMKISGLEAFLQRYPNSVVKEAALEQLMRAYQQSNNAPKALSTADQILQVNPNNLSALALLAFASRASAESGQNPQQNSAKARELGERGLKAVASAPKPEGISDADFQKFKAQVTPIFAGAAGFGALQVKDYATAQQDFQTAVNGESSGPESLRDVYPLAVACLEANPMNPAGLWYAARAVALSNNNADIARYGAYKYAKYHGSKEGWDQLVTQASQAGSNALPPGFSVAPAPSPAEQARNLAKSKDPKQMSFDEWQVILEYGDPDTVQSVWNAIKGMKIPFVAKVISAERDKLSLAATADDIQTNTADAQVTMAAPLPVKDVPEVGKQITVQAVLSDFQPKPFTFVMTEGQLVVTAPAKKTPPRRRPTKK